MPLALRSEAVDGLTMNFVGNVPTLLSALALLVAIIELEGVPDAKAFKIRKTLGLHTELSNLITAFHTVTPHPVERRGTT